ncbi:MAG TPA: PAS domain S-box protein, partial [Burkholderiales bacterium]|nr:PAS domain S-box protein [Burkholderiales bacterium]
MPTKRPHERAAPRKRPFRVVGAVREREHQYSLVLEMMAEGVVLQLADGTISACNRSAERILGLSADQMAGRSSLDPRWRAVHEDGSPFPGETHPAMVALHSGVGQSDVRMGVHRPDGSLIWISINSQPLLRTGETRPYAAVTSFHDITARRRAEQDLLEEQQRLALVTENVPAMIAYVDAQFRYRYANQRYRVFYAGSEAPIAGRRMEEVLTPQTWQAVRARVAQALAGEAVSYGGERLLRDGRRRYVSVSLVPHRDEGAGVLGAYVLAMDITAQHETEVRLGRLSRLHAMLSGINAAIVRVRERRELFEDACRIAVEAGRFRIAWIGVTDRDAGRVRPVAWAGEGARVF